MIVPAALVASQLRYGGPAGRAFLAELPGLVTRFTDRWSLRPDGPPAHGMSALVLPVVRPDGVRAALKLQPMTAENAGVATALRIWDGGGIVRLLDHDPATGTMLLERLDGTRPLSTLPDDDAATEVVAGLLARLVAAPAPAGVRRLSDIATAMLEQAPRAAAALRAPADRQLLLTCAAAVAELVGEVGDRLLHWDLHHDNVLAGAREPWLAIDPEPLAGDPGFDLWPALDSRWDAVVATGDVERAVLRRFDLLTATIGLDRHRAVGWTLGRILQNTLWDVEDGAVAVDPAQVAIASALRHRAG